jgi:hypothetical protein
MEHFVLDLHRIILTTDLNDTSTYATAGAFFMPRYYRSWGPNHTYFAGRPPWSPQWRRPPNIDQTPVALCRLPESPYPLPFRLQATFGSPNAATSPPSSLAWSHWIGSRASTPSTGSVRLTYLRIYMLFCSQISIHRPPHAVLLCNRMSGWILEPTWGGRLACPLGEPVGGTCMPTAIHPISFSVDREGHKQLLANRLRSYSPCMSACPPACVYVGACTQAWRPTGSSPALPRTATPCPHPKSVSSSRPAWQLQRAPTLT